MITGIAIFAHGSAVESANEAVRGVVRQFAASGEFDLVEPSFLELGHPNLAGAVARLVERGAGRVVVVPYFLTLGKHLQRDLPKLVDEQRAVHPGVEFHVTPPLDGHPSLAAILVDRARAAVS
ncbi:MAG: CbiX/SirB N-terminal domain-containing protein [Bryobacterales bacterium]|nr:CbiX/SirB N-terminal domain-containing protein [Bryobacterales bacterium]